MLCVEAPPTDLCGGVVAELERHTQNAFIFGSFSVT